MIGVYNKKQRMSIIKRRYPSVIIDDQDIVVGSLPKSNNYVSVSHDSYDNEGINKIDNFLEKLYTIIPKEYHPHNYTHHHSANNVTGSLPLKDKDSFLSWGELIHPNTVNLIHHLMANKIQKYLNENKKNAYALNIGPYHDNVIERGGTHEDYANELLPHLMLKMPQKMYNFLISHKGPVENVKKDFIDHLSKNPEHSDQLDLDYMNILSPE
jgi:hypothetical protein